MKIPKKAVLCMDVDGTLIDANETIHQQDASLLEDFPESIQPILTTGRSLYTACAVLHHNNLFRGEPLPLPGVFLNGGAAYLPGETLCTRHIFTHATLESLRGLAPGHDRSAFTFFTLEKVYLVNPNTFARHISQIHYLEAVEVGVEDVPDDVIKLMVLDQDKAGLKAIKDITGEWEVEGAYSLPYAYEINPPGITKANTLAGLLNAMAMDHLPIYTVGDGENDLSLFKRSRKSFAPASAHPAILEVADEIIHREKEGILKPIIDQIQ